MTLAAHQPFTDRQQAIQQRRDIVTQKKSSCGKRKEQR